MAQRFGRKRKRKLRQRMADCWGPSDLWAELERFPENESPEDVLDQLATAFTFMRGFI